MVEPNEAAPDSPYRMSLSLNVLNHLGLSLYSNMPAVLSEVVANAWDADASDVHIVLDTTGAKITISDDGVGMGLADINERFLHVGYQRRKDPATRISPSGRKVMGRKGIGKLSLFSIAERILVETARENEKHALVLDLNAINEVMGRANDATQSEPYKPEAAATDGIDFSHGTRITLTQLKRDLSRTAPFLARRLARRFAVLGPTHNFRVWIGDREVSADDRGYEGLVQYLWSYGPPADQAEFERRAPKATEKERRSALTLEGLGLSGWIGTVFKAGQLRDDSGDNLNKVTLLVRGKLAQEDLLEEFNEGGIYRSYIVGEVSADFLDVDDLEDIATSSRQRIREDDPRYEALLAFLQGELLHIQNRWTELRNKEGTKVALDNAAILAWFETLDKDDKKKAESLFGKINQLTIDNEDQRAQLFAHGVLAFESMRYRDTLDRLETLEPSDISTLAKLFVDGSDLEAALYHRIVSARLTIIRKLDELVDEDVREKFLQEHLFTYLWLLDPGWERATDAHMELSMAKAFEAIKEKLTPEEADSRIDIRYKRTSGLHVIVELKRASVVTDTDRLSAQVRKYREVLRKALLDAGRSHEGIEVVCVVGRDLRDWSNVNGRVESAQQLAAIDTRVIKYDELLSNARAAYSEYLAGEEQLGRVRSVLETLEREPGPGADKT
ncbi:MAG: hypothetical protein QOD39_928 [Mycobacterium sp.]|nr:hypothetical protein [Mycobacterium sp.]